MSTEGVEFTVQDVRVIMSLLGAESIRQSSSSEVVVRECGRHLWEIAARLKLLADSRRRGTVFRLAVADPVPGSRCACGHLAITHEGGTGICDDCDCNAYRKAP